jgi:RNA polymerase sigma-70 factor, ECF subfamily
MPINQPNSTTEPPLPERAKLGAPGDLIVSTFTGLQNELVSTLVYMLGNRDDALDMVQEAFIKCWKTRHTVGDIDNLRAWIFRVAMNCAKDLQRSAWKRRVKPMQKEELMTTTATDPVASLVIEDQEAIERLKLAIATLRQDEKEVFLLRQNGELTYEEIADIRQTPVGTIKTQMRTALIKLRKVLHHEVEPEAV